MKIIQDQQLLNQANQIILTEIQSVHKVPYTFKILISQKPHKIDTLNFRQ